MKKATNKIIKVCTVLYLLASMCFSKDHFGMPNDYLQYGVGARALSMGGAFVALADDGSAPYFNPAGLAQVDDHRLLTMYGPHGYDTSFNYLSYTHPIGQKAKVALADVLLFSSGFEERNRANYVVKSNQSILSNAAILSYAYKFKEIIPRFYEDISIGINLKFLQENNLGYSGHSFGADLGFLYKPISAVSVGMSIQNIFQPKITLLEEENVYKTNIKFGFCAKTFKDIVILTADINKLEEENMYYACGFEFTPVSHMRLRIGYNHLQRLTFGIGFTNNETMPVSLDYAFNKGSIEQLHKIAITFHWGNIYRSKIKPLKTNYKNTFILSGLYNEINFLTETPSYPIKKWTFDIENSKKEIIRHFEGDTKPPKNINWDVYDSLGKPVNPGTYFYTFKVIFKDDKSWEDRGKIIIEFMNKLEDKKDPKVDIDIKGREVEIIH